MGFAYMPSPTDKMVMYGGLDSTGVTLDSTWTWDPQDGWQLLIEHSPPGPRTSTRMVYDDALRRIVLFGGKACQKCGAVNSDTWMFNGVAWSKCSTCRTKPPARISEGLEYDPADPANPFVLMFGGFGGGRRLGDTWMLSGSRPNWVACSALQCPARTTPSIRTTPGMAYDDSNLRVLLFGGDGASGSLGDTWFFDARLTPAWSQCPATQCPLGSPSARLGHRMVLDTASHQIVLFGAAKPSQKNDVWLWQGIPGSWALCDALLGCPGPSTPAPRCCVGLAFDTAAGVAVMFGGAYDKPPEAYGDTWTWDPVDGWVEG